MRPGPGRELFRERFRSIGRHAVRQQGFGGAFDLGDRLSADVRHTIEPGSAGPAAAEEAQAEESRA